MDADYCLKDSKIREILHILKPPLKRNYRDSYEDYIGYVVSDSDKEDKIHFAQNNSRKKSSQRAVRSSLSLVLQKTCKKQIFQGQPFSNKNSLENQSKESDLQIKPTIKVTVIPKRDPNCLFKYLDTQNQNTGNNKKDSAPCNDGNSIATKNLYLVVAGRKEDKIYELKTSKKTSKDKSKDVKFDAKRFPSKMEKKRKKTLSDGKPDEQKCSNINCFCQCPKEDLDLSLEDDYPTGASRVRIVGRIGLDHDDKYVMKCAATVNGEPVETNAPFKTTIPGKPQHRYDARLWNNTEKPPMHFSYSNDTITEPTSEFTTSQATQVNSRTQLVKLSPTTDRNTQCNLCELYVKTKSKNSDEESKPNRLNRSTSPLVIISVFPKPELKMFALNTVDVSPVNRSEPHNYRSSQLNKNIRVDDFANSYTKRDLSPNVAKCCPCESSIKNDTAKDDTKASNTKTSRTNRARSSSPGKKSPKSKTHEQKTDIANTNNAKSKSRSPSPNRFKTNDKTNQRERNQANQTKKVGTLTKRTNTKDQENGTRRSKARDLSVNTIKDGSKKSIKNENKQNKRKTIQKHIQIKNFGNAPTRNKTLVKEFLPKNEISKVSINIDSDKEYYDVVFENGSVTTDVTVRRTAKDNYAQNYFEETFEDNYENNDERHSGSLENFFPNPEAGQHRRSASQAFHNEITDVVPNIMSRLNVRDSLEIGHRRDHSRDLKSHPSKTRFDNDTDGIPDNNFYVPSKHYPGDNCVIDPVERDKEIRELLGIDHRRTDKRLKYTEDYFEYNTNRNNSISRRCLLHDTLCKPLTKKPLVRWSYSSCTEKRQDVDNNCKKDEEKSITDDEKHNLIKLSTCAKNKKRNVINTDSIHRVKLPVVTKQQSTQYSAREMLQLQRSTREMLQLQRSNKDNRHQKQNAIILSGKQYRKVKKLINNGGNKTNCDWKKRKHNWNSSIVSIGSVKAKRKSEYLIHYNRDVQTDPLLTDLLRTSSRQSKKNNLKETGNNCTVVLFCKEETDRDKERLRSETKKVASSIEIRYTSIAYSNMGERSQERFPMDIKYRPNPTWKRADSIETIFKGHKKSFTPNLGTSSLSVLSDGVKSTAESLPTDSKPRKPFLRRLMSCLVMRSQTTAVKGPTVKKILPTLDSSVDSYYISTSLGALDMTSSIYDTSVSFYSNHTIGAVNNKIKRGFLNSVREFLSVRKY